MPTRPTPKTRTTADGADPWPNQTTPRVGPLDEQIRKLQSLRSQELTYRSQEARARKRKILARIEVGRIANRIQERAEYGDGALEQAATASGYAVTTLRDYARYYRHFGDLAAFRKWVAEQETKDRSLTWSIVRAHVRKNDGADDAETQYEARKRSVERKAQDAYDEAQDLLEEAHERRDEEGVEMAAAALRSARDTAEQIEGLRLVKPKRIVCPAYIEYVKREGCVATGRTEQVEFHHLETGGTALKGSDLIGVGLHTDLHVGDLHGTSLRAFEEEHDVNLYREAYRLYHDWTAPLLADAGLIEIREDEAPRETTMRRVGGATG
jgi:hypothetical protein